MLGTTQLAMCMENIDKCSFMRIYTVWRKTYWKGGKKYRHRVVTVLDNTSMNQYQFDLKIFNKHFELIDKDTIKPNLWKKIQNKKSEECDKKRDR